MKEALTVSIPEAAKMLGISRNLAYAGAARGEIPTVKVGHRVLVPRGCPGSTPQLPAQE